jgi:hypothetical protein
VAVQGRAAEAELLFEGIKGGAGQQGQVDVMSLGMVADGTSFIHDYDTVF